MFLCKEDRKKPTIMLPLGRIALRCHCNGKQAAAAHFDQVHCQIRMPRKGQWFSAGVWNWGPGMLGQPGSVTFLKWNWATFNGMQLWTDGWNNQIGSQARKKNPITDTQQIFARVKPHRRMRWGVSFCGLYSGPTRSFVSVKLLCLAADTTDKYSSVTVFDPLSVTATVCVKWCRDRGLCGKPPITAIMWQWIPKQLERPIPTITRAWFVWYESDIDDDLTPRSMSEQSCQLLSMFNGICIIHA